MAEKVVHEVRFIETDDGFRIEVKGDKERMKKMGFGHGFGPGMGFGRMRRHFRRHGGPWGYGPGPGFGPWWDEMPQEDTDDAPAEKA
jgi:hypothetical protein